MKTINIIKNYKELVSKQLCYMCKKVNYAVRKTCNGSFYCPICNLDNEDFEDEFYDFIDTLSKEKQEEIYIQLIYCPHCGIAYMLDLHHVGGCSNDIYTAVFITKFSLNDKVYEGMPKFNNVEKYKQVMVNGTFIVLETESTNKKKVPDRYCGYNEKNKEDYYSYDSDCEEFGS